MPASKSWLRAPLLLAVSQFIFIIDHVTADKSIIKKVYTADPAPIVHNDRLYMRHRKRLVRHERLAPILDFRHGRVSTARAILDLGRICLDLGTAVVRRLQSIRCVNFKACFVYDNACTELGNGVPEKDFDAVQLVEVDNECNAQTYEWSGIISDTRNVRTTHTLVLPSDTYQY